MNDGSDCESLDKSLSLNKERSDNLLIDNDENLDSCIEIDTSYKKDKTLSENSEEENEEDSNDYDSNDYDSDESSETVSSINKSEKTTYPYKMQKIIMDSLLDDAFIEESEDNYEDLSEQIQNFIRSINWKKDLTDDEIEKYKELYEKISADVSNVPQISEVLKLSMPYEEKCDLFEKLLILYNSPPVAFEFIQLKKHIEKTIKKYQQYSISEEEYSRYQNIRDSLILDKDQKPIEYKILDADISDSNKEYIYNRYKYLEEMDNSISTYNKLKQWIDCALSVPFKLKQLSINSNDTTYKINKYLWNVKEKLDKEIYGMETVKEKILFLLNNIILSNRATKGLSFGLCGPPGVAKTSIILTLAKAIELPFFQINTGGMKDSAYLLGHNYTYDGSSPGIIVQALQSMKYKNGILYFDEFDKISNTEHGAEISRALLHITDFEQNSKFHDKYLSEGIDIDLSHLWFIYSLNDEKMIDPTLRDRIPIIHIPGYSKKEKYEIFKNYLLPKALNNIGINKDDIIFTDEAMLYLIEMSHEQSTSDSNGKSGVRQLNHLLNNLLMKINFLKTTRSKQIKKYKIKISFDIDNFKLPIIIDKNMIEKLKIKSNSNEDRGYLSMYS